MILCPACGLEASLLSDNLEGRVLFSLEKAVGELHKARQALDDAGQEEAAQVLSEAIWNLEADEARVEALIKSGQP